jgi:hypothetical protein
MVELKDDSLVFSFADVHPSATVSIKFNRTLRIPDDGKDYPLPPGLGCFPIRHVDDFASTVPPGWMKRGGVMLPMYQSEAMWMSFRSRVDKESRVRFPFAIKIAAGKINAVTGQMWTPGLHEDPQDYVVVPKQPWLDGFCVKKGTIRQFVAMPLGHGYTAEEQITDSAQAGGVQIIVYPMRREAFERLRLLETVKRDFVTFHCCFPPETSMEMGLGAGGRMKQGARCFVHIANSQSWHAITGDRPPTKAPTAGEYTESGLPWFDYYADGPIVDGSPILDGVKSIGEVWKKQHHSGLPGNESVDPESVVKLQKGRKNDQVREGAF